jgi:DNA-binding GntR family transcriptional regulator
MIRHAGNSAPGRRRIRDLIQQAILRGEYAPGQKLRQMELARRFGVAQSVVRESLLDLRLTGLVEVVDRLGVYVGDLGLDRLLEAYEIRESLEGLAARLCCKRASRDDLKELAGLAEQAHCLGRARRTAEMGAVDRAFHLRLIAVAGNQLLQRLSGAYRILGMTMQANRPIDAVHREHLAIVKAIGDNDPSRAERQARRHVASARQAIARQAAAGDFQPRWVVDPPITPPARSPR